jgi:plasmid stabilization system protein ParE
MDYQVVLSSSSRRDLQDIVRYIALDDPSKALQFGRFLIHHTKSLGQFPERGRVVPELEDGKIREIIIRRYRVIDRLNHLTRSIEIIKFWHAGRGRPVVS